MRPVDKGLAPAEYADYRDAGSDLQTCIGEYCSYCERRIETHLAVEHIQPKSRLAALRNAWSNFLLGCVNCNSCKGHSRISLRDYLWPDSDNTLRALEYTDGGLIRPNPALSRTFRAKARATIKLTGLDRVPGNVEVRRRPSKADRRWLRRVEAWQLAVKDRQRLVTNDSPEVRELIVENAVARGMFSIWWTVFTGEADMRRRLREAFVGTDGGSFDAGEDVQRRVGGQV
jgi:uncharacterized protein (TIGR02646 family)